MKLALPFSNVPGFDIKVKEELDRLVATNHNFSKLRFYIDTGGKIYPEIGILYEELANQAIINVEIHNSFTSDTMPETDGEGIANQSMMMEEGGWFGDMSLVKRAKEFPSVPREGKDENVKCRKRYQMDVELGDNEVMSADNEGEDKDKGEEETWTDAVFASLMCILV